MNDDEKGKRFLEAIDEQNNLQWSIVAKLSSLINFNANLNIPIKFDSPNKTASQVFFLFSV